MELAGFHGYDSKIVDGVPADGNRVAARRADSPASAGHRGRDVGPTGPHDGLMVFRRSAARVRHGPTER